MDRGVALGLVCMAMIFSAVAAFFLAREVLAGIAGRRHEERLRLRVEGLSHENVNDVNASTRVADVYPLDVRILLALARAAGAADENADDNTASSPARRAGRARQMSRKADEVQSDSRLLLRAGLNQRMRAEALGAAREKCMVIGGVLAGVLALSIDPIVALLALPAGAILGKHWPDRVITACAQRRRASCERDLPVMLDIIALCVQAGMSFDRAMQMYCSEFATTLARECERAHTAYQQGVESREKALRHLADELELDAFERFVESSTQSIAMGAPLEELLLSMARDMRSDYKSVLAEKVEKAPVKMLLPLGTLILPAMLIIMLGPVALSLLGSVG